MTFNISRTHPLFDFGQLSLFRHLVSISLSLSLTLFLSLSIYLSLSLSFSLSRSLSRWICIYLFLSYTHSPSHARTCTCKHKHRYSDQLRQRLVRISVRHHAQILVHQQREDSLLLSLQNCSHILAQAITLLNDR